LKIAEKQTKTQNRKRHTPRNTNIEENRGIDRESHRHRNTGINIERHRHRNTGINFERHTHGTTYTKAQTENDIDTGG